MFYVGFAYEKLKLHFRLKTINKNLNNVKGIKKMELDLSPAEPSEVQLIINLLQSMFEATANLSVTSF